MSNLTDRAAYLRGMADGLSLDPDKKENKLLLEMLNLLDEMAQTVVELDADVSELEDYVEDLDADLSDMEDVLFGDDDDEDCDCCDCDDDDCDCGCEALSIDCPNCGKTMLLKTSDIDFGENPVCEFCHKPFFTDLPDEDEDDE